MDAIAELLAKFHCQYPDVRLHTYGGDADSILERLDKGQTDMGLLLGPIRQEKYDYLPLHLTFRPIVPELSIDLYMVTKKYQILSPAAKIFFQKLRHTF